MPRLLDEIRFLMEERGYLSVPAAQRLRFGSMPLEIEAEIPSGAPEHLVRTVTENARTLKFTSREFEKE